MLSRTGFGPLCEERPRVDFVTEIFKKNTIRVFLTSTFSALRRTLLLRFRWQTISTHPSTPQKIGGQLSEPRYGWSRASARMIKVGNSNGDWLLPMNIDKVTVAVSASRLRFRVEIMLVWVWETIWSISFGWINSQKYPRTFATSF